MRLSILAGSAALALGHNIAQEFRQQPCEKMCIYITGKTPPGRNYQCECHDITSADGFVLQTARLRPQTSTPFKGVAFLMHGFLTTGMDWVVQPGTSNNLAYMLSDAGFDVWLGNNRGNVFSVANSKMDINTEEFWDAVDVDNMASTDVPAIFDYVLETTKAPRLHWVGHSMGGGQLIFALAKDPSLADRLGPSALLAPGVHMANLQVSLLKYMALHKLDEWWHSTDYDIPTIATSQEYFPGPGFEKVMEFFTGHTPLCKWSVSLCNDIGKAMGINVGDAKNLDYRTMADAYDYDPGGSSFHLVMHWAQRIRNNSLHEFDWGKEKNMQKYNGSSAPPLYDLSKIKGAHLALFAGDRDLFVTPKDVDLLYGEVPQENWIKRTTMHKYAHMDFVWGKDAHERLFPDVIKVLSSEMLSENLAVVV